MPNPQSEPARIFIDFEFLNVTDPDGTSHLTPLSVGMCSGGKNLYLEYEADLAKVGRAYPWLIDNVIKHLRAPGVEVLPAIQVASRITQWVTRITHKPQFWAYRAASDWTCLFSTYGGFKKMPPSFGASCHDLGILADLYRWNGEHEWPEQSGTNHLAIADAQWNQQLYNFFASRYTPFG